ncbi:ribonuclease P protein component [Formosimonas limnophila]|nr:ribonuclease P protein component [Formosimonas limnophila]
MTRQASLGLPPCRRILKADAYASALCMRICAQTADFALHFCATSPRFPAPLTQPWAQLGLVIPKKLAKRAVTRNTLKRLSREHFRLRADGLADGLWVVRLRSKVSQKPLSSNQKRLWAEELCTLFDAGQQFVLERQAARS